MPCWYPWIKNGIKLKYKVRNSKKTKLSNKKQKASVRINLNKRLFWRQRFELFCLYCCNYNVYDFTFGGSFLVMACRMQILCRMLADQIHRYKQIALEWIISGNGKSIINKRKIKKKVQSHVFLFCIGQH